jgi:uncharacterized membrane protein YedE/YeeE
MVSLSGLVVGALLGVVLHRGDFCMHSAFRELLARRPGHSIRAWLVALGLQVVVVNGLAGVGWLVVFRPTVELSAALMGGFLFGIGMVMGKG